MTHRSRSQWEQIRSRVEQVGYVFDPAWKCLIDGTKWSRSSCDHNADDQDAIIEEVRTRFEKVTT